MICQRCQESPATVHLTRIEQKKKIEFHLCEACAHSQSGKPGSALDLPPGPAASSLQNSDEDSDVLPFVDDLDPSPAPGELGPTASLTEFSKPCPHCGLTLTTFRNTGRLGCPHDYEHFRPQIKTLIEKLHGASQHRGKLPPRIHRSLEKRRELDALKKELELVVATENYETAATLLERIRKIERELEIESTSS